MRKIPLQHAQEHDLLAYPIYDEYGRTLLKSGLLLTKPILERVSHLGIQSVYVTEDHEDLESLNQLISPVLRAEAVQVLKKLYNDYLSPKLLEERNKIYKESQAVENLKSIVQDIIDELFINRNTLIEMVDIKKMDTYYFEHCVNTTAIALLIGLEFNLKESELRQLGLASLLMDIGYKFLPKELLYAKTAFTPLERAQINEHVNLGFNVVKNSTFLDSKVRQLILQHHEHYDGSGYPNGINGAQIDFMAQIISISDMYDALTSDRPHRPAYSPSEALEIIMTMAGTKFSFQLVDVFSKKIVAYPVGTYVQLSNGLKGIVTEVNRNIPLRPVIEISDKTYNNIPHTRFDLSTHLNVTIVGILHHF